MRPSHHRPPSLTRRLILWLTAGAALLWLLGALASAAVLRGELAEAFDAGLRETAERLMPLAEDTLDDRDGDRDAPFDRGFDRRYGMRPGGHRESEYIVYQLRDRDGRILMLSHDAPDKPFDVPLTDDSFADIDGYRVFTVASRNQRLFLHVAEELEHRDETLGGAILALLLPLVAMLPLSALGIFYAVRRGLRPVHQLSAAVAERHAAHLDPVPTDTLPLELRPMAESVNGLLDRLRAALSAERAFAANSAHEMRTPIAGSLAQVQRLIAELADGAPRERARQVAQSLARLGALAEKLLQLARAEAGMAPAAPHDLLPALRLLAADRGARVTLELTEGASLAAPLDIDAFGIVMRNLIDNALSHGADGNVTIRLAADNVVEVLNAAKTVPAETLAKLVQRFERGDATAPGTGLGLAIVTAILAQVGGTLELLSPAPGRADGFCARLTLPRG
ncbi:sensor histidine kinase [Devosia sp.]|uniref:sensor histidine kinase n=1 Tax=Devosia sp. TaxID=1871048 RepID=UPI003A948ECE